MYESDRKSIITKKHRGPIIYAKGSVNKNLKLKEVKKEFKRIKNREYKDVSEGNYGNELLKKLMDWGSALQRPTNIELVKNKILYRTRAIDKNLSEYKNIREFFSPPSEYTGWGRVNRQNRPMLYASINDKTAYQENGAIKDQFFLIRYRIVNAIQLCKIGKTMTGDFDYKELLGDMYNKKEFRRSKVFYAVDEFIEMLMLENKTSVDYYKLTNDIVDRTIIRPGDEGLYYKSAVRKGHYNVAIKPKNEIKNIVIEKIWVCSAINKYEFTINEEFDITKLKGFYRMKKGLKSLGII